MPACASRGRVAVVIGLFAVAVLIGCGSEDYAPVSGIVTLNGKPLADAKLIFEPVAVEANEAAGKPSYGKTDAEGRYTLTCPIAKAEGAAVGEHRVRIVTTAAPEYTPQQIKAAREKLRKAEIASGGKGEITDQQVQDSLSDMVQPVMREKLPARYNATTELTITVPPEGTSEANFDLTS